MIDLMIDLDFIRNAPMQHLLDLRRLEVTISRLGLFERPGMIPAFLMRFVGGIRAAQWPCQVAPYLIYLADKKITSYAEIGVLHGGMFRLTVEYLSRFNRIERALAMDPKITPEIYDYAKENPAVIIKGAMSTSVTAAHDIKKYGPFDLVLIDADHSEEMVRHDYELVKPYARMIAFHDISEFTTPGVRKVFDSLPGEKVEFTEQYEEITSYGRSGYGLGVVINDQL